MRRWWRRVSLVALRIWPAEEIGSSRSAEWTPFRVRVKQANPIQKQVSSGQRFRRSLPIGVIARVVSRSFSSASVPPGVMLRMR